MTIQEYEERFREMMRKVETDLGTTMVKIGNNALAMIKTRVIEEGKDAKGGRFPPYSTDPMLVGAKSFRKKDANKFFGKEKNKQHRWVTLKRGGENYHLAVLEGGYKELRSISLGAPKGEKVDFSFTNAMWGDVHVISGAAEHNGGTVIIGALRQEEKDKLYYNTERNKKRGGLEILDLSEIEINKLKDEFLIPILNIFK